MADDPRLFPIDVPHRRYELPAMFQFESPGPTLLPVRCTPRDLASGVEWASREWDQVCDQAAEGRVLRRYEDLVVDEEEPDWDALPSPEIDPLLDTFGLTSAAWQRRRRERPMVEIPYICKDWDPIDDKPLPDKECVRVLSRFSHDLRGGELGDSELQATLELISAEKRQYPTWFPSENTLIPEAKRAGQRKLIELAIAADVVVEDLDGVRWWIDLAHYLLTLARPAYRQPWYGLLHLDDMDVLRLALPLLISAHAECDLQRCYQGVERGTLRQVDAKIADFETLCVPPEWCHWLWKFDNRRPFPPETVARERLPRMCSRLVHRAFELAAAVGITASPPPLVTDPKAARDALGELQLLGSLNGPMRPAAAASELSRQALLARPRVQLFGPAEPPVVDGLHLDKPLTKPQYAVVEAHPATLSKDELGKVCGDAVKVLKRLAAKPEWTAVIQLAGEAGKGYAIR